jgi:hypothetical protein
MSKALKQTNIILLLKLIVLSFIFCLPKAPAEFSADLFFTKVTESKISSFFLPSNIHFEHKILKKIPLLESALPDALSHLTFSFIVTPDSIPPYTHSKISHYITSSFARGPPQNV